MHVDIRQFILHANYRKHSPLSYMDIKRRHTMAHLEISTIISGTASQQHSAMSGPRRPRISARYMRSYYTEQGLNSRMNYTIKKQLGYQVDIDMEQSAVYKFSSC